VIIGNVTPTSCLPYKCITLKKKQLKIQPKKTREIFRFSRWAHANNRKIFLWEVYPLTVVLWKFCLVVWVCPYFKFVMKVAFWQKMTVFGKMWHTEPRISREPLQEWNQLDYRWKVKDLYIHLITVQRNLISLKFEIYVGRIWVLIAPGSLYFIYSYI
jgi:hypothetical protein